MSPICLGVPLCAGALLVLSVCVLALARRPRRAVAEDFSQLAHPTRSFAAEAQLPEDLAWLAQPSKCFDCDGEILQRFPRDPARVWEGRKTRCLSCAASA